MKFKKTIVVSLLMVGVSVMPFTQSFATSKPSMPLPIETVSTIEAQIDAELSELLGVDTGNQSFKDMLIATYQTNPNIMAARSETRAIFQQLPIADSAFKPNVTADASVTQSKNKTDPGDTDDLTTSSGALNLTQPIFRGGRSVNDMNAAENAVAASLANLQSRESQILLDAITAHAEYLRAAASVELNENNLTVLNKQRDATGTRFRLGDGTKTDVALSESRAARAQADVVAARGNLKTARANFLKITGLESAPSLLPVSDIEMPSDLDIAQTTARDYNPDLRASFFNKRSAGYTINSRLGNHLPEVNLQGSVSTSRDPSPLLDQQDSASIGIVATMPLYEGGATTARVREARQTYNARVANNIAMERDVVKRVTESWENWQSAKAEIEARQTQVKASAVAQFGARKESEFGARSLIDTLDTDQEYLEAQEDLLTAKRNEIVARYSLLSAMGMLTPSILGFADKVPNFQREIKQARRGF